MEIRDANGRIPWRVLALDGAEVPAVHGVEQPSFLLTGPGETVDVQVVPRGGDLRIVVRSFNNFESAIRVVQPRPGANRP